MSRFLGARDLGLQTDWRFRFVGAGTPAQPVPGVIYVDVGGALRPGVLDHHAGEMPDTCAADVVFRNRELAYTHLLSPWLARWEEGRIPAGTTWNPTIVTHGDPDLDGAIAIHLVRELVETGDFPPYAEALAGFAREVDQGRARLDAATILGLHAAFLAVQNLPSAQAVPAASLELGLSLIARVCSDVAAAAAARGMPAWRLKPADFAPGAPGASDWAGDPRFADVRQLLDRDQRLFQTDLAESDKDREVRLPARGGFGTVRAKAFVLRRPPASILNKYWVRGMGWPVFVCPYGEPAQGEDGRTVFPRVIISVDPNFSFLEAGQATSRRPTLAGLGYRLEKAETMLRRELGDGTDARGGPPRYPDGYCTNSDPWYDGRAHEWTIVDSPRAGTLLPYAEVVRIATESPFWEIELHSATVHLVWFDRHRQGAVADAAGEPVHVFPGMAAPLEPYLAESRQRRLEPPLDPGVPGVRTDEFRRHFPSGTAPAATVLRFEATPPATLEAAVVARQSLVAKLGNGAPDYVMARVRMAPQFVEPASVDRLLRELGDVVVAELDSVGGEGELVLFGSRTLIVREDDRARTVQHPDPDFEVLLYAAFLSESLVAFSRSISDLVPPGGAGPQPTAAQAVRERMLRFQTRYFQLEISRLARGRRLFSELSASLQLLEHYREVLRELDHLTDLENQAAEGRRARAEQMVNGILFFIGVAGVLQTLAALWTLPSGTFGDRTFLSLLLGLTTLPTLVFLLALRHRS